MSLDATLIKGGNLLRVCDVTFADGKTARVEPYAIYTSPKKRRHYLWFQIGGSDPEEAPGWKSPEATAVASVRLAEESFTVRRDYNPFDKEKLPVVHHAVPTHDGRQRWHDAVKFVDKQAIGNRNPY